MPVADQALQLNLTVSKAQRAPIRYSSGWALALASIDLAMFVLSSFAGLAISLHTLSPRTLLDPFLHSSIIFVVIWLVCFERFGLYKRSFALSVKDEFYYTVAALIIGVIPQLTILTLVPSIHESRLAIVLSAAFAIVSVGGARTIAHAARNAIVRSRPRRIAIVGNGDRIALVAESLNIVDGTEVLRLDVPDIDATVDGFRTGKGGSFDSIEWFRVAKRWGCDTLLLTEMLPPHVMPLILEDAVSRHIKVAFAPPRVRAHAYSLSLQTDGVQALIVPSQLRACTPPARLLKRLLDLSIVVPALIVFGPIMAVVALAIWLDSGSPILFRQERVTRGGKTFNILKFRSMRVDAEAETGPVWASIGDDRITKLGAFLRRTSMDELPQLFNVVRGDMSIVGPRPERPVYVDMFQRLLPRYDERHLVRPGITGWSQVNMRRVLQPNDAGEKLSYDLFYVEHWSLFMDLSVIFKTGIEFLFHRVA
jgi:exopolysaccharide biosynthesis polyprenyl glycosylphosphotransferase